MRQILETEEYVQIPPQMYSDPFYRITYLIKEEIRKHKWIEGEKGHKLSWEQARQEWADTHREKYEKFLMDTLLIAEGTATDAQPTEGQSVCAAANKASDPALVYEGKSEHSAARDEEKEKAENREPVKIEEDKANQEKTDLGTKDAMLRVTSGQL
jgi:hypothetical protein